MGKIYIQIIGQCENKCSKSLSLYITVKNCWRSILLDYFNTADEELGLKPVVTIMGGEVSREVGSGDYRGFGSGGGGVGYV